MTISAWDIYLLTRLKGLNFILAFATCNGHPLHGCRHSFYFESRGDQRIY